MSRLGSRSTHAALPPPLLLLLLLGVFVEAHVNAIDAERKLAARLELPKG